jgi:hypothetical protein
MIVLGWGEVYLFSGCACGGYFWYRFHPLSFQLCSLYFYIEKKIISYSYFWATSISALESSNKSADSQMKFPPIFAFSD